MKGFRLTRKGNWRTKLSIVMTKNDSLNGDVFLKWKLVFHPEFKGEYQYFVLIIYIFLFFQFLLHIITYIFVKRFQNSRFKKWWRKNENELYFQFVCVDFLIALHHAFSFAFVSNKNKNENEKNKNILRHFLTKFSFVQH